MYIKKKKKFIERIIYNFLFNHFLRNKRFPLSQLGFTPEDLCISQLLSTIIEIQTVFDNNPAIDVRGVFFLHFQNWHGGLIFKLIWYGVETELLSLLKNYLQNREQRVALNG